MGNIAIRVEHLSKQYHIGAIQKRYGMLRDRLAEGLKRLYHNHGRLSAANNTIWALKDVSFEVEQGEVIGIIGRNGAGKSTLLKLLTRITDPTEGRAEIYGRVGSLLEVGTGFHPELTGRENIYLNGAILGMKKVEIDQKFDEIIAFAEVEKFIDTPVKRYSSGMYVRLAFAVAAHLEPEILLVDEVLSVGDAAFQRKCLGKMGDVASQGRTVLFVSHNMAAVQQLTRTSLLLHGGRLISKGSTENIIRDYLNVVVEDHATIYEVEKLPRKFPNLRRQVEFLTVELESHPTKLIPADAEIGMQMKVRANESVDRFRFSMTIFRVNGTPVGNFFGSEIHSIKKGEIATYVMQLKDLGLAPGVYYCSLAVGKGNHLRGRSEFDHISDVLYFEVMAPEGIDGVMAEWNPGWGAIRFKEPKITRTA